MKPTELTEPMIAELCRQLAEGKSLRQICKAKNMPPETTVRYYVIWNTKGITARYNEARLIGLDVRAENLRDMAQKALDGVKPDDRVASARVLAIRLIVDTEKWLLSKLAPKTYGDRQTTEHIVDRRPVDESEVDRRLAELEAKVAAAPGGPPLPDDRLLTAPAESPPVATLDQPTPAAAPPSDHK